MVSRLVPKCAIVTVLIAYFLITYCCYVWPPLTAYVWSKMRYVVMRYSFICTKTRLNFQRFHWPGKHLFYILNWFYSYFIYLHRGVAYGFKTKTTLKLLRCAKYPTLLKADLCNYTMPCMWLCTLLSFLCIEHSVSSEALVMTMTWHFMYVCSFVRTGVKRYVVHTYTHNYLVFSIWLSTGSGARPGKSREGLVGVWRLVETPQKKNYLSPV